MHIIISGIKKKVLSFSQGFRFFYNLIYNNEISST